MELAHLNSYWPPATRETKIPLESKPQGTKEIRFPKNSVRGRYLATFSSNCFAINENQVAALVAAAVLVATSGHQRSRNRTHFIYDLYEEIASVGQTVSSTLADFTARVSTPTCGCGDSRREEEEI